jgi:hypothetical protein
VLGHAATRLASFPLAIAASLASELPRPRTLLSIPISSSLNDALRAEDGYRLLRCQFLVSSCSFLLTPCCWLEASFSFWHFLCSDSC